MRALGPVMVCLLLAVPLAGCLAPGSSAGEGVVVTGQPALDAFERLGARDAVVGIPDWAIVDEPGAETRVGRPFAIGAEAVVELQPRLVLDQPHPLVSGPNRQALETGVERAGITYETLPTAPELETVRHVLDRVGNATGQPYEPVWQDIQANLTALEGDLEGLDRPKVLVLFPAGLTAGEETDVDRILELAGLANVAAMAGLTGYQQITDEAIQRTGVDLAIATSSMDKTPAEVAAMPMLDGTRVDENASRALVVDPSRTTRLGPYVDQAARMLATWAHPQLDGPQIHATLAPTDVPACGQVTVETSAPNATVELAGERHPPGAIDVPKLPPGHYRVRVHATDATGSSFLDLMISLEGTECEPSPSSS